MIRKLLVVTMLTLATPARSAGPVTYGCGVFAEEAIPDLWMRIGGMGAERAIEWPNGDGDAWLYQNLTWGTSDYYQRSISEFSGEENFFIQWRAETTSPADLSFATPAILNAAGNGAAFFATAITGNQIRFWDGGIAGSVPYDIEAGVPHTYRLEIFGDRTYDLYIDAVLTHSGVSPGDYPLEGSVIAWGAGWDDFSHTTRWSYVRYGRIPDTVGDYDSDGDITSADYYFIEECMSLPESGPGVPVYRGCEFADFDGDNDVDFHDFAAFQRAFTVPQ